jgi:hypothetical protein
MITVYEKCNKAIAIIKNTADMSKNDLNFTSSRCHDLFTEMRTVHVNYLANMVNLISCLEIILDECRENDNLHPSVKKLTYKLESQLRHIRHLVLTS